MNIIRAGLPDLPPRMRSLPINEKGYPIPKFVAMLDGKPDFRVVDVGHMVRCVKHQRCWICGEHLGVWKSFVFGPLAAMQRVSNEPPSHLDCAHFAVAACPFMLFPHAKHRGEEILNTAPLPGNTMMHNPGVSCIWVTTEYSFQKFDTGIIFNVGKSDRIEWYTEGRRAKRMEVLDAINRDLPKLKNFNAIHKNSMDLDDTVNKLIESSRWLT